MASRSSSRSTTSTWSAGRGPAATQTAASTAGVGEHAVYVDPTARGRGLGRTLLTELCAESERHGLYKLTSRVFADNEPRRAAHRAAGFEEVGIQRRHGKLDGQWKDCVLVERLLGPAAD